MNLLSFLLLSSVSGKAVCGLKSPSSLDAVTQTSANTPSFISTAWFAGWHAAPSAKPMFTVANVSWAKYTHMTYAFAEPSPNVNELSITSDDENIIPGFVSTAHANNVSTSISLGGWAGSRFFSVAVATAENRTAFIKTISNFVQKYKFDGVDFDWEYPNKQGIGCNTIAANDSGNFLELLRELRSTPATKDLILSAAVGITPFVDASGNASTNVAEFSNYLDFIEVMDYDIWGSWSATTGPNSPLDDSCAAPANQQGSSKSAIKAWTGAGFAANKILIGLASYGRSFSVPQDAAIQNGGLVPYAAFNKTNQPVGDSWDDPSGVPDVCGNPQAQGGTFDYWGLHAGGFLAADGKPANDIKYTFDNCSQTAFIYNPQNEVMVAFDDRAGAQAKGQFIKDAGLLGFSMWEVGGDHEDTLLDAVLTGAGFTPNDHDLPECNE